MLQRPPLQSFHFSIFYKALNIGFRFYMENIAVFDGMRHFAFESQLKKNLVLAVINRRGEIVYYSLSELNLK